MTGYTGGQAPKERRGFFDVERRLRELFDKVAEITSSESPVDHGALTGLSDDDHGQYALADGSRGAFDPLGASTAAAAAAQAYAVSEDENRETIREAAEAALETSLEAYADQAEADAITAANGYTDAEVGAEAASRIAGDAATLASATAAIDDHVDDATAAHAASAVSYDGSGNISLVQAWLTANDLQAAVGQLAGQLYTPDEATTEALIDALNALVIADPDTDGLTNPDLFSSDLIVARHIAAGSVTTAKIDAQAVTATEIASGAISTDKLQAGSITTAKLATDAITSTNYIAPGPGDDFSIEGSYFDLAFGNIQTPGLWVDGGTGGVSVKGEIEADALTINDSGVEAARFFTTSPGSLWGLDTGFSFQFPGVEAARTRGVSCGALGALGVDNSGTVAKFVQQVSSSSELSGGDSYQYGTAQVYGYSNIDTGYAEATLNAEAMLGSPGGSGALSNASLKVIAVPEGYAATSVPYSIEAQGSFRVRQGFNEVLRASTAGVEIPTYTLSMGSALGDRIYLYGGDYKLGIEPTTLRYDSDGVHRFMTGGAERARFDGNGLSVPGRIQVYGGNMTIGGWSANGAVQAFESPHGYLLMGQNGVDGSLHLRTKSASPVNIGANQTNTLAVGDASSTFTGVVYAATFSAANHTGGYVEPSGNCNSSVHSNQNLQIRSSGTIAGLSMWPTNYGIAPVLRCFVGHGESIDCGNNPGTGYAQFGANNFVTWSARRGKKNIKKREKAERDVFRSKFRAIETVIYDDAVGETKVAKSPRFSELNKRWIASGKSPLEPKVAERDTVSVEHDCDLNPCNGTADEPCGIVRRHRNRRGIVAEELLEILPQAVSVDMFGETMGIDYGVVLVEMIDVVQDLMGEVEELKAALARGKK